VYSWAPGWSILICGLIGGTAAFFLDLALGQEKPVQANSDSNEMGARDGNTL